MPETIGVAALVPQKPPNCECHLELQVQPGADTSTQEVEEFDQSYRRSSGVDAATLITSGKAPG
jgi:hypothetical protein